jgi:LCP family protein required for cell wall assembly
MLKKKWEQVYKQKSFTAIVLVVLLFSVLFFNQIITSFSFLYNLTLNNTIELKKEKGGSFNILLLGIGGGSHDGPELTDTIILTNINLSTKTVNLISVPRDLWIPKLKDKINKAYSSGQEKGKQGMLLAKATAQEVLGQQIDYVVVLDFSGFTKLVDYLGGIDVNVLNTLDDYNYPLDGKEVDVCDKSTGEIEQFSATASAEIDFWEFYSCRYTHLHIDKGLVHMDGKTALSFVRSRHAEGAEGTDFARSARQQQVIAAIRQKILSLGIILNPLKIIGIYNIISSNINTNIQTSEFDDFIKLAQKMQGAKIQNNVIDAGDDIQKRSGLLIHPDISKDQNFEWVLIPRIGDGQFGEIHEYVECIINGNVCKVGLNSIEKISPSN